MVFLVDFIARGLGWGVTIGASFWVVFGLGAVCGPFVAGWLGDRIGFGRGLSIRRCSNTKSYTTSIIAMIAGMEKRLT